MKVLVVGGGGREHAIVHHLKARGAEEVIAAPGNPGIAMLCRTVDIAATDAAALALFSAAEGISLAIVGPEVALAAGVADALRSEGVKVLGPNADAARLETSKSWAKELMRQAAIPTAHAESFTDAESAHQYIRSRPVPIVIKADGLAAGKGVVVCRTEDQAHRAVDAMLTEGVFGESGASLLVEEFLDGEEYSMMVFTDGTCFLPMPLSQDHKPINDGDKGPNTGGMGAYAPVPSLPNASEASSEKIFVPLVAALRERGIDYKGIITGNFIWTKDGPFVIEFNARFGDPEAEVTLPLLQSNLTDLIVAIENETLAEVSLRWSEGSAVCVAMTAEGYPGTVRSGDVIHGLEKAIDNVEVLHAGTRRDGDEIVTDGGRVLIVTGIGETFEEARALTYKAVDGIDFEGEHHRTDIGWRAEQFLLRSGNGTSA